MPSVEQEFRIVGIRRGGNHAINNWVCGLLPKDETLNLRNLPLRDPIDTSYDYRRYSHDDPVNLSGGFRYAVLGYENVHPADVAPLAGAGGDERTVIVVLRDAFNNAASIVRMMRREQSFTEARIWTRNYFAFPRLWDLMSGFFRSGTASLEGRTDSWMLKVVMLNYNTWFQDRGYREEIAAQLDLPFSDAGLQTVSSGGGGSAFDRMSFDGKAQDMGVLDRWRGMEDDLLLNMALINKAVRKNHRKIYGELPFQPNLDMLEKI